MERLYERQFKLLLAVRKLWRHAEFARGELPAVPKLPPLHAFPASDGVPRGPPPGEPDEIEGFASMPAEEISRFLPRHFSDLYMPKQLYGVGEAPPAAAALQPRLAPFDHN